MPLSTKVIFAELMALLIPHARRGDCVELLVHKDHRTNIILRWVAERRRFVFVKSHALI
jgi:hypothetical protein